MSISIINDESIEGNETFTIYLTSDVGVNVSPYVQTEVTIIDDDKYDNKADGGDNDNDDDGGGDHGDGGDDGDDGDDGDRDDVDYEGKLLGLSACI